MNSIGKRDESPQPMERNISNFIPGVIGINALALIGPAQSRLEIEVSAPPPKPPLQEIA